MDATLGNFRRVNWQSEVSVGVGQG